MNRYTDRVVAISGAAQGLGLAMATRFAAEGATVAIADINEKALADSATSIATAGGAKHRSDAVDVTDSAQVANWIDGVVAEFGRIDVLINNAGIIRDNRLQDIDDEDWRAVLDVSLTGSFYCARAAFGPMKHQGYGRIISMSSMSWRGNFGQSNYVAAKAGIVGLTRTLALEGARHGITANAIAPGLIETPMLASMNGPARDKLTNKIPMGHTGRPEDIAEAAAFLASEAAGYLTGVVLDVDGGISIGSSIR
ncbi:SDR family oxidoreductase [Mycobacterium sp. CBMA293]|uniref:SDR family NAD(P)-dependent oxidoreductase n=1 Tax=unclassified Mycolicibacterium TaxID=2636767 RepID=UPI0012DD7EC4|nr:MULTISPECIES: SDR family NAD(P)-dependent oxidoreductase [unclassified Mycolicibacterium]MUL49463.1 SDR family oxidoreductase [Mycolicibacterium sp. CBMA 360]MUL57244.1 SDR family oxidoreductase [Mycolicibacterium sp. CBMA 335]MUL70284.1 SDR family oxidoreductase [Mycolicibacterium sp. CBMA 311]MUL92332.1 SDR family oxidoreductase [Mycolicibacterium sp. CBMA 230]MUM06753.1 3-oxoacyl-ACP reductase [Mycolicibacterium sp. CBMA 213]